MWIAITGGRDRIPTPEEMGRFWNLWRELGGTVLLHGAVRGTDFYVAELVASEGYLVRAIPVCFGLDGAWPGAGPRRNRRMLVEGGPLALIAFPGDEGTADCRRQAKKLGIPVYEVAAISGNATQSQAMLENH